MLAFLTCALCPCNNWHQKQIKCRDFFLLPVEAFTMNDGTAGAACIIHWHLPILELYSSKYFQQNCRTWEGADWQLGRCKMIFDEQNIGLVLVTSAAEGNSGSSVDKALNNKTGQHSPAFYHLLIKQFHWMLQKLPPITICFPRTN